jgi:glycosyltransferase involved in cell wall biosynthesis
MTSPTAVSVVITFFNASTFLAEAVQSVVAQTYDRWEVLLVDDGSTDDSAAIAKSWVAAHPARMRYLDHPDCANRGISASRNLGIAHANGEFVAFLDADDVWLPNKLERQVHLLRAHPDVGMIYGRTQYWRSWTGNAEGDRRDSIPSHRIRAGAVLEPPALLTAFLWGTARVPCICSVVVRRSLVEGLAGFEDSFRGLYEDQVFYAKVCLNAPVLVSDECLERYRQHAGSLCALSAQSDAETTWRRRYLHWLSRYVSDAGVVDPGLSRALRAQLWVWEEDRTRHLPRWTQRLVRTAKTTLVNVAALVPPSKTS